MPAVEFVDDAQNIVVHLMVLQAAQSFQDPLVSGVASLVEAVTIVQLSRSVHAQAHEEAVLFKEATPIIVQESTVCLDRVSDLLRRRRIPFLQLDNPPEKINAQQCGLAALPGEIDDRMRTRFNILTDELLQGFV